MSARDREWYRGAHDGYDAAREMLQKYGVAFAQRNADQLSAHARKRDTAATSYDRGYAAAYREIAYGVSSWYPNGSHNTGDT